MSVEVVKIPVDSEVVIPAMRLAERLRIPFDGVVYAGVVAITKGDQIPTGTLVSRYDENRYVKLSPYTHKILKRFADKKEVNCADAINRLLRFALRNESLVDQYYRERIDNTSPTKISKSR